MIGMLNQRQFFHVTTEQALPSIRQHGLNNELATEDQSPWGNVDDWDSGAYVFDHPAKAIAYARGIKEMGHRPVVLGVDPKGVSLQPDLTGASRVPGAWHAAEGVPKENVRYPKRRKA